MSHKHHTVVLTYHRVPDAMMANAEFHDLSFDRFRRQMEEVARRTLSNTTAPNVCITFDDGTSDHLAAGDLLSELGLTGTFFIITGRLGKKGYLTRDQVLHLARQGHRIGSHTVNHRNLTKLSMAELDKELITSKRLLEDLTDQTIDWFAPPGGIYNRAVLDRALALGYSVFRTMEWGYPDWPLQGRTPCFPILAVSPPNSFQRILDGEASVWLYLVKTYLKKIIGEVMYGKLRYQLSELQQTTRKLL
jgi:peptidoglycan/xylan/chitin deacetylase (PgdA/CDA1 family)